MRHYHKPIEELYHYTSFDGLKGILESKKLWLTDYQCTNDLSEFGYSKAIFQHYIKEAIKECLSKEKCKSYSSHQLELMIQVECKALYEIIKKQIDKVGGAYIFRTCFNKLDSGLYTSYAQQRMGYAEGCL